uniref:Uncharacterized protein n=1 Tax=Anguilla anguilla TaxID=7936 RepID=A0A0E9WAG7_ANGAN
MELRTKVYSMNAEYISVILNMADRTTHTFYELWLNEVWWILFAVLHHQLSIHANQMVSCILSTLKVLSLHFLKALSVPILILL